MTRALTTAVKNEIATNDIRPIHLITIGFATPVNITDCSFDLTSSVSGSSVTYSASSHFLGISDFTEQTDVSKSSISITLSVLIIAVFIGDLVEYARRLGSKEEAGWGTALKLSILHLPFMIQEIIPYAMLCQQPLVDLF